MHIVRETLQTMSLKLPIEVKVLLYAFVNTVLHIKVYSTNRIPLKNSFLILCRFSLMCL